MSIDNWRRGGDWNGQSGDSWLANQNRLDAMLTPFGQAALDAAGSVVGMRVVDVGCGTGTTSLAMAEMVGPAGQVTGLDISATLVERAAERGAGISNLRFRLDDAASAPLSRGAYDLFFSRFGVMFFDAPVPAFAHMRRALRPGGRMVFACWRSAPENDWVRLPMTAIRELLRPVLPPDPDAPGPFSFGDKARVGHILMQAGFADIAITPFDRPIAFGKGATRDEAADDALDAALQVGPLQRALADQPDAIRQAALPAVRDAFAARWDGQAVTIDGAVWIVTAASPG